MSAPDYFNFEDVIDKTFYGIRFTPSTGKLLAEKVLPTAPEAIKLPEVTSTPTGDIPYTTDPNAYRAWAWTTNNLKFSWNNSTGHLLVEVY